MRHLVREDDTVSSLFSYEGTHKEEFAGVPGSGRSVKFAAWDLFRIEKRRDRSDYPVLRPIHHSQPDRGVADNGTRG